MPIAIPYAEQAPDGVLNLFDLTAYQTRYDAPGYEVLADWDLNGTRDFFDFTGYQTAYLSTPSVGRGILSNYGHRFGYAGYWYVPERGLYHVRNRWYSPENGRWLTRDPIRYASGSSLYAYQAPIISSDPSGENPIFIVIREIHFRRNAKNNPTPSEKVMEKLVENSNTGWTGPLPDGQSKFHRIGDGNEKNTKYVNSKTGEEGVYRDGVLVTDDTNGGTWNAGPKPVSLEHVCFDILPYLFFGNGPDDETTLIDRFRLMF